MAIKKQEARPGVREAWGILLLAACLFLTLSLISYDWRDISVLRSPSNDPPCNYIGPVGAWLSFLLLELLGLAAYLIPVWCVVFGMMLLMRTEHARAKAIWAGLLTVAAASLLDIQHEWWRDVCDKLNIHEAAGGVLVQALVQWLAADVLGKVGVTILVVTLFALSVVMFFGTAFALAVLSSLGLMIVYLLQRARLAIAQRRSRAAERKLEEQKAARQPAKPAPLKREEAVRPKQKTEPAATPVPPAPAPDPGATQAGPTEFRKPVRPPARDVKIEPKPVKDWNEYQLPPTDLLDPILAGGDRAIQGDIQTTGHSIVETLAEFGIEAEIVAVEQGPVVTRYELRPAAGVRVERIAGLSNNLALSLKATSVRVQTPIPGKGVVGVEVPNSTASIVYLREVLEGERWAEDKYPLPLALGKDIGGMDIVADLTAMPHLLIAGATGSGKTVCMNSILAGLLMSRNPSELRLMLIDPKIVEFSIYDRLPHLVVPVITDPKKVAIGLLWAIREMEKRYKLFAKTGVRNITAFNSRLVEKQEELFAELAENEEEKTSQGPLPYIVIVIDELADLMLTAQAEIESCIARLAQLSRAVGIHMVLATQRPSVNVITGTIKANFPSRIAFQVAQKVDSRTILDANGAEKLLGRGDMLFLPPGSSKMVRAQGSMVSDAEISRVVDFIKKQAEPSYETAIKDKMESARPDLPEPEELSDEMLELAIQVIRETHRASTSSLQRRLRIGYTRAARIMDVLEQRGIVGPPRGSDPREILIDLDGQIPENKVEIDDAEGGAPK